MDEIQELRRCLRAKFAAWDERFKLLGTLSGDELATFAEALRVDLCALQAENMRLRDAIAQFELSLNEDRAVLTRILC